MAVNKEELTLQIFDGSNYDKWRFRLKLFLEMKECIEVINHETRPSTIQEELWNKKKIRAKNYVVHSISNTQLELVITEKTAKKMVEKLDEIYMVKSSAIKLLCKRKLLDLKMKENDNPKEFFNEFERLINSLKNTGETVSNDDKLNYLLLALPENMSHIVDIIDALPDKDKSVEYVKTKLTIEFQKRESNLGKTKSSFEAFNTNEAKNSKSVNPHREKLNYRSQFRGSTFGKDNNKKQKNIPRCFRCNKPGHIQRNCWYGRNQREMNNESTNIAGTSTREDRDEHNSFNVKIKSTEMAGEPSGTEDIKWLLDSGCSDHIKLLI